MLFAWVGYPVYLYDVEETRIDVALAQISWELDKLEEEGSLRGTLSAAQQLAFIHKEPNLEACVRDAVYIQVPRAETIVDHIESPVSWQECVYEDLELKKKVFKELDSLVTSPDVVLASSTSCHPASTFTEELTHRDQVLVAHPIIHLCKGQLKASAIFDLFLARTSISVEENQLKASALFDVILARAAISSEDN
ncbi:CRYL1 [Cordylochernes scorpioides]|uniref:CRYL1 n=1 Tax=Cordylochernes scorpioides TaxID=51811 RepID=A0ABY6LLX8_9ARAC|nr:CRYL1 [Cordylochernes scorpioides]